MSNLTYTINMKDKPLVWLHGEVKTPPLSTEARLEMGFLLRSLQKGHTIEMPRSRPMPSIGIRCHELRVDDNIMRKILRLVSQSHNHLKS